MRKIAVLVVCVMLVSSAAYAATEGVFEGMLDKVTRGAMDAITGWIEVPMQIHLGWKNGIESIKEPAFSKPAGAVAGIFTGVVNFVGRTTWGVFEFASFWAANPVDNKGVGIPLDDGYAWQVEKQYDICKPDLGEGFVKPVGNKAVRGLSNLLLGVAEVPGQTMKGIKAGHPFVGTFRGVWFFLSREVDGANYLWSFLLPNPKDNPGYAFEEEWPWEALTNTTK